MSCKDWKKVLIKDIVNIIIGYPFKSAKFNTMGNGIRLVRGKNITRLSLRWGDDTRWWSDFSVDLERYLLKPNDIVIGMDGSLVGKNYSKITLQDLPLLLVQRVACLRTKKIAYHKYIWYCIANSSFEKYINAVKTGTSIPHISGKQIGEYQILLPSLPEQKAIAAILSALDDKIELNNKINKNLEEMAQAIFKSWFVDFEPFQNGEFVESELGLIPKGWRVITLNEVCKKITDGSHFSPKHSPLGTYPMFSVKDMNKYGFNYDNCKMISSEDFSKMLANDCVPQIDDILVAKDGSYLKEIFIINDDKKDAILSSIAIFRANQTIVYPEILLYLLKSPLIQQIVKDNFVSGSALPRIVLKDFKKLHFVLAPKHIQNCIKPMLSTIRKQIAANLLENNNLINLRDTLLPKLMNGEIRVPLEVE